MNRPPETWRVVANDTGHHSVWPAELPTPKGWRALGPTSDKQTCLEWIAEHWIDPRAAGVARAAQGHTRVPAIGRPAGADGGPQTLTELFRQTVAAHGDAIAVSDDAKSQLTYAELDRRSATLARRLIAEGIRSEDRVGIYRPRDVDYVVTVLGILRAGAAYVAVDDRYPDARRDLMLRSAGVRMTLTDPAWCDRLSAEFRARAWRSEHDGVELDRAENDAAESLRVEPSPNDAACVLFTSGSTGTPKAVVLEHRNVVWFGRNSGLPALGPGDRVGQIANVSFDAVHFELWCTLAAGAELVMLASLPDLLKADLRRELRRRRITALLAPTMAVNHLAREDPAMFSGLRVLHTGGEVIRPAACRDVLAAGFAGKMFNLYGPTETTTAVTAYDVANLTADALTVPIGSPLPGAKLYVLDPQLSPVAGGAAGELYIGGDGVGRGYFRNAAATAERFLPDPFGAPGAVMYATGDLVREGESGVFEYQGRADNQVKIRGYRVEPAQVEKTLMGHPAVRDVAVVVGSAGEDHRLIAFVVSNTTVTTRELREYAATVLPDYEVPSELRLLPSIPTNDNGKRDTRALLALVGDGTSDRPGFVAPQTPIERYLVGLWEDLLGIEGVGTKDDFFMLGGHSMLLFRAKRRIERDLGLRLAVEVMLERTVLADLAAAGERELGSSSLNGKIQ